MNLLAIETTGAKASAALISGEQEIWEETCDETLNHLRFLMPMLQNLLKKSGLTLNDVDGIAVSEGPGSFTGIRIGMASAKALAQALELDMVCVPTLKSFAYHDETFDGLVCPIFDARRSQIYGGAYRWREGVCQSLVKDGAYELGEFLLAVEAAARSQECWHIRFFGDGISAYQQLLFTWQEDLVRILKDSELKVELAEEEQRYQKASSIAKLGCELWERGQAKSFFAAKPVYLRKAEAERKLEEKRMKEKMAQGEGHE